VYTRQRAPPTIGTVHNVLVNGNSSSQSHGDPTTPSTSNGAAIVVATGSTGSARSSLASQRSANGGGVTPQPTLTNGHHSPVPIGHLQTNGFAPPHSNGGGQQSHDEGLVQIRMRPDAEGRYGFNVKGGRDQNHTIIVSRVAAGSAAELCYPRLNEGDQVLVINGRDVSQYTHEQVVALIRMARESAVGDLVLTVRPNGRAHAYS
jgi:tyrosine-protein phosphatase non-receptor type 4